MLPLVDNECSECLHAAAPLGPERAEQRSWVRLPAALASKRVFAHCAAERSWLGRQPVLLPASQPAAAWRAAVVRRYACSEGAGRPTPPPFTDKSQADL